MDNLTMKTLPNFATDITAEHSRDGIVKVTCKVAGLHFEAQYDDRNVGLYAWEIPDAMAGEVFARLLNMEDSDVLP